MPLRGLSRRKRSLYGRRAKKRAKTQKAKASRALHPKINFINNELEELAFNLALTKTEIIQEADLNSPKVNLIKLNRFQMFPGKNSNINNKKKELIQKIRNIEKGIETFKSILEENGYIEDTELTKQHYNDTDPELHAHTI